MELNEFRYDFELCHRGHGVHRVIMKIIMSILCVLRILCGKITI